MFFVISGFCLGLAASRAVASHESIGQFLYRRAKRIFPAFWCAVLLICVLRLVGWFGASRGFRRCNRFRAAFRPITG